MCMIGLEFVSDWLKTKFATPTWHNKLMKNFWHLTVTTSVKIIWNPGTNSLIQTSKWNEIELHVIYNNLIKYIH